ncbi:hypothetical protein B0T19DRAFT_416072 [Cercophora scortea]|uniref:CYTH domain-containing protein n=1 Tax=Cercophora scortea TaxID=314031 RepID=A0AAE0IWL5_9PEZI|nr:hypothetical protein B0T19DRAFT_416072 [Cercophora scortea]
MPTMQKLTHLLALTTAAVTILAATTSDMKPNYEVKFLMDPALVLDATSHKLTADVLSALSLSSKVTKMNVQFLDTDAKDIYNAGWSPRIRKMEKKEDELELTYKKRYPINGTDLDATLALAASQGFSDADNDYEPQVEWGFEKQTLSISNDKSASSTSASMDLPDVDASRAALIAQAPDKFVNWLSPGWGNDMLAQSRIFGPVLAKRSTGTWNGTKLYVEVWPIRKAKEAEELEYVVEASFKADTGDEASAGREALRAVLSGKGWLLEKDSLKTQMIMDRY